MREMTTKNSPRNNVLDSLGDLTQLTQAVKAWGKELGFQKIRIADAAADEKGLEASALQPVEDFQSVGRDVGPADVVFGARDDDRTVTRL